MSAKRAKKRAATPRPRTKADALGDLAKQDRDRHRIMIANMDGEISSQQAAAQLRELDRRQRELAKELGAIEKRASEKPKARARGQR